MEENKIKQVDFNGETEHSREKNHLHKGYSYIQTWKNK